MCGAMCMARSANGVTRPVLRWHGGKWKLAPWIISNLPPHRIYVEPFGGAASILLRKSKSYSEVYNDLDDDAVNLFRVLRNQDTATALIAALRLTPFSRTEFQASYEYVDDPVERARRLVVRAFQGYGSDGPTSPYRTGFRANSNRSGTVPAHDWANYPAALTATVERLREVIIENRDAVEVMQRHDTSDTLHYVDPPYLWDTRSKKKRLPTGGNYKHELTDEDHLALLTALKNLAGMVVVSGYPAPLYDEMLEGWLRIEQTALADGARQRTEVLWINPAAAARLDRRDLFTVA